MTKWSSRDLSATISTRLHTWNGSASKTPPENLIEIQIMFTEFTSSAIESISDINSDGQVDVTFTGGRKYTYGVSDVENFVTKFNEATSKGQFINRALREDMLTQIAV